MRQGNWKAHGFKAKCELYNLAKDPSETKDLASTNPEKARELSKLHGAWLKEMVASENAGKPAGATPAPARLSKEEQAKEKEKEKEKDKKLVWWVDDPKLNEMNLGCVQILDVEGDPANFEVLK